MIFSISWSSTAFSAAASIWPLANLSRASLSGVVRSRLPTWSARKGGVLRCDMGFSFSKPRVPAQAVPVLLLLDFRLARVRTAKSALSPNLFGQFHDHAQLGPLLLLGQHVAFLGRGKAALRRQT